MALQATAPPLGPSSPVASGTKQDIGSKDVFLKLLVAQMSNQDPLKPSDPTQMSAQLARFNMVEQQINTNQLLEQLVAAGGSSGGGVDPSTSAASYLGRTVSMINNTVNFDGATAPDFTINLGGNAAQTMVSIVDSNGNTVRTMSLPSLQAGDNPVSWDGLTDSGAPADPGTYSIEVSSSDVGGVNVPSTVFRTGVVESVRFTPYGPMLVVGGTEAMLSDVFEISL